MLIANRHEDRVRSHAQASVHASPDPVLDVTLAAATGDATRLGDVDHASVRERFVVIGSFFTGSSTWISAGGGGRIARKNATFSNGLSTVG